MFKSWSIENIGNSPAVCTVKARVPVPPLYSQVNVDRENFKNNRKLNYNNNLVVN